MISSAAGAPFELMAYLSGCAWLQSMSCISVGISLRARYLTGGGGGGSVTLPLYLSVTQDTRAEKFESLEWINSIRETIELLN